jgi:diaminohydroxyphosphoribosylaminopyrimidine deaminase/5-amino-6-(5-phosphoribosylamino)uracil reductase
MTAGSIWKLPIALLSEARRSLAELKERAGRPLVTLKLASSLDGRIATRTGDSRWLTGAPARARGHWLRATHDAIMVGSGTALADDPALTCRLPGLAGRSPVRIVLDGRLRLSPQSRLAVTAAEVPVWLFTREGSGERAATLRAQGVEGLEVAAAPGGGLALAEVLAALAARGITRLLVEGGAGLAAALLKARLVDRLAWFQAPLLVGGDGLAAVAPLGVEALAAAVRVVLQDGESLAQDRLQSYILSDEGEPCSPGSSPMSVGSQRSRRTPPATAGC